MSTDQTMAQAATVGDSPGLTSANTAGDAVGTGPAFLPRPRRATSALLTYGLPSLVFALFVGFWYLLSYVVLSEDSRFLVPPPHEVIQDSFVDADARAELFTALWLTTKVAAVGLAIAIVLGVALAVAMSQAKWIERSLFPYAVALQCLPILAMVPLIGLLLDFGFSARVVVCVLIALFPLIANTLFGLQSADRGQHDLFTLHGAGRWTRLRRLQFPAAMPAIFVGLRNAAGLSVIGAIVGDFFFKQGDPGIGILIDVYRARLQNTQLYGAIILSSLLGIAVFLLFGLLGRRAVGRWYDTSPADRT